MCQKCKDAVQARYDAALALRTCGIEASLKQIYDKVVDEPIPQELQDVVDRFDQGGFRAAN